MKKILYTAAVAALLSSCASYHIRQGNRLHKVMAYSMAIEEYQKGLSKKENADARRRLAECYRKMNDLQNAETAYGDLIKTGSATTADKLAYAQLLMRNSKYDQASSALDQYLVSMPNDDGAKKLRQSCDSIDRWKADSLKFTVQKSSLNNSESNFSPVFYKEGVVFTSDKGQGKTYAWTGKPYLDMYYAKGNIDKGFSAPTKLPGTVNGVYHDGPVTFSSKGDTMYFTRNNYINKKVGKSTEEVVNLKIFHAIKKDTSWTNITEFAYNSDQYSTGHPTLSSNGSKLYFTSDMPGGIGGTDIWMSERLNNKWSKPINLGSKINTAMNEMFPTIYRDSVLYFSSEGHMNMGGLDIFSSTYSGSWSQAQNTGYPINSNYDDFGIAINDSMTAGLFSSNRNSNNTMQDQLYSFTIKDLRFTLSGIAVDKDSQQPLEGVVVELLNVKTGKKEMMTTGPEGTFKFKLDPESEFTVMGKKDKYFTNTERISTIGKKQSEDLFVKLKLEMEHIVIDKPIVLENIYYDLDKYDIRPDAAAGLDVLVGILNDNPTINIELSSHTDSRADDQYNMLLSQKRAESAVNYILNKGIAKERITARGYGESKLMNRCSNDVKCSEEEHQQNRRTEFKVVSMY